ncbi:MAG: TPM domain-containing protein [Cardiobacteriaceae bacterium]|nr:TPM domain-containing protein [Cardiobacteriaceae bacterium]
MKRALRAFALLLAWLAVPVFAVPADSLRLDNPVVDQAGVIADEAEIALNAQLRQWRAQGLMQGAVVLVDSTDGMSDFDYAMQVAKRWQLGDKVRDDGLLLLVAVNDRNLRFVTGSGIEGALPDISAKKIIREQITPFFRNGDYAGGVRAGLEAVATRLAADPAVQAEMVAADRGAAPSGGNALPGFAGADIRLFGLLPIFFIIIVAMSFMRRRSGAARGFSGLAAGGFAGIVVWTITHSLILALIVAIYFGLSFARDSGARATRRRHRRDDDDDDWFSGRFGGGFGGGFGSGGGGFGGGGGYSGGGGSFSGGGAGGSW